MQVPGFFRLVGERIDAEDAAGIDAYLALVPFDKLEGKVIDAMLERFLRRSTSANKNISTQAIIASWKERVTGDVGSISTPGLPLRLLTSIMEDDIVVAAIQAFTEGSSLPKDIYADETVAELENLTIVEAIEFTTLYATTEPDTLIACKRSFQAFGDQPEDMLRALMQMADGRNNDVVNFIAELAKGKSSYAPVPPWVNNTLEEIPTEEDLFLSLPDPEVESFPMRSDSELVEEALGGLESLGVSIEDREEAYNELMRTVQVSSLVEKAEILRPVVQRAVNTNLENDVTIGRIVGPANPLVKPNLEQTEYGGPRMLTDDTYDYDRETGIPEEWFTGNCQVCLRKIRYYWHAIRMPETLGGWEGCYCSKECVVAGYEAQGEFDPIQRRLIDIFHEQLMAIGIQERLPNPEEA